MVTTVGRGPRPRPCPEADKLFLLDGFRLVKEGVAVPLTTDGQRLVALLALCGPRNRTATAGVLWPEAREDHARGSLRTALWRVQRSWPGLVAASADRVTLSADVEVDCAQFGALALHVLDGRRRTSDLLSPADLSAGELLPGWYDDWVLFERERLRQLRMHALERLSEQLLAQRCFALALEAALEALRMEPLRESAHSAVIAVHLAEHNLVEAQRQYEALRRLLWSELRVSPSARLQAMVPGVTRQPAGSAATR
jgi:DNA-binding SARP family transcriptional activator